MKWNPWISQVGEYGNKFLGVLGKMDTENFSGFVRGKISCMLLRNENRAMVVFVLCHLSMKNPMHIYGPLNISTHNSLFTLLNVSMYTH